MRDADHVTDTLTVRPLGPADTDAINALYAGLDLRDSYLRFFSPLPHNVRALAESIAREDATHRAVGAFLGDRLVGAANYVDVDVPGTAEVALVVAHDEQLHGIGTAMLDRLGQLARAEGIRCFVADILAQNARMMRLLFDVRWPVEVLQDGPVVHVTVHIDAPESDQVPGLITLDQSNHGAVSNSFDVG